MVFATTTFAGDLDITVYDGSKIKPGASRREMRDVIVADALNSQSQQSDDPRIAILVEHVSKLQKRVYELEAKVAENKEYADRGEALLDETIRRLVKRVVALESTQTAKP